MARGSYSQVPAPDGYRDSGQDLGTVFAQNVRTAINDMRADGITPTALLADTVFSSVGIFTDPPGFLSGAVAAIREVGGAFVADEVQPGFGHTGFAMWGFQRHGIVLDLVTISKPMDDGHPMAGMAASIVVRGWMMES